MYKSRIFKKTILKWIISLALFISITITVISVLTYSYYSYDNYKLYSEMAESTLLNASKALEMLDSTIINTGFLAANDNDIIDMMSAGSADYGLQGILKQKLNNLNFTNPIIYSTYIVNKKAGWIIGSPAPDWIKSLNEYCDSINNLIKVQKQNAVIRINTYESTIRLDTSGKEVRDNINSYVFFQTRQSTDEDSFLIINIKQSEMLNILKDVNTMTDSMISITDKKGRVVFSKDPGLLYKDYGNNDYMRRILKSKSSSGFFEFQEGPDKSLVTYVSSEKLGYYFISMTPYETVRRTSIALKNKTVILAVVILFLGLVAAIVIAMYFYLPLWRLINKYIGNSVVVSDRKTFKYKNEFEMLDEFIEKNYSKVISLDNFVNDNFLVVRQDLLKGILEGRVNIDNEVTKRRLSDIGMDMLLNNYQVIYLNLDNLEDLKDRHEDLQTLRSSIGKIAEDFMKLICSCETVRNMNDWSIVILLNYDNSSPDIHTRIKSACLSIQEYALRDLNVVLTAVIGKTGIDNAHTSFQNAVELLNYKMKYGDGSVIDEEKVAQDITGHDQFPEGEEKYLIKCLRSLSVENSRECISQIVNKFYGYSISDINYAVNHILYSTFLVIKELIKNRDASSEIDFFESYEKLKRFKSLQEIEDNLIIFYESIIIEIDKTINRNEDNRSQIIVKKVVEFIRSNYKDPRISLEFVANNVKLNPIYLGKLFNDITGLHFTEYVNNLRLDIAKELLEGTDDTITQISSSVGFNSIPYFVTCFKKYTGITPTKFRESRSSL